MTAHARKDAAEEVRQIVETEEKEALARFRSSRFGERLHKSIAQSAAPQPRPGRALFILRPLWVSASVLMVLAATAVWLVRPGARAVRSGEAIEAWLHRLPGLEAIENPPGPQLVPSPAAASPFEKNITSVISHSAGPSGTPVLRPDGGRPAVSPRPQPLGLERVYEILFIDRSVERVLADLLPKTKEG